MLEAGSSENNFLRAATGHVRVPGAAARYTETPFLNGSVLEEGRCNLTWVGLSRLGRNSTDRRVGCEAELNFLPLDPSVNSPQRRNPEKATQAAA
jgi:hypothetical protein